MDYTALIKWLDETSKIMAEQRDYLIQLDSVVGDGDLGLTMSDGFLAAYNAVKDQNITDCGMLLYTAGKAMGSAVPSSMGTLMASGLMRAGKELKGKTELTPDDFVTLFKAYEDGVADRGKAKVGEKTFLDGLNPAVLALKESLEKGDDLKTAAKKAAEAAEKGFENTTTMVARHGRAAARGEASRSIKDPGAAVAMFMIKAFSNSVS